MLTLISLLFLFQTQTPGQTSGDIDWARLEGREFVLFRPWPWSPASHQATIQLVASGQAETIGPFQVQGLEILDLKDRDQVPGTLAVTTSRQEEQLSSPLNLNLSGLERAGQFQTGVVIRAQGWKEPKLVPLKITVKDAILFPLLVIALGVFTGYLTRWIGSKWRPQQENRYKIIRLRSLLQKDAGSNDPELGELLRRLDDAEQDNLIGNPAAVKTELEDIQGDLASWQQNQNKQAQELTANLGQMADEVAPQLDGADQVDSPFYQVKKTLLKANELARNHKFEECKGLYHSLKDMIKQAQKHQDLLGDLKAHKSKLQDYSPVGSTKEDQKAKLEEDIPKISTLLKMGDMTKAEDMIRAFASEVKDLLKDSGNGQFRSSANSLPANFSAPEMPEFSIRILTPHQNRVVGKPIAVEMSGPDLGPHDKITWSAPENEPGHQPGWEVTAPWEGDLRIDLLVEYDGIPYRAHHLLMIQKPQTERQLAQIQSSLQAGDWLVSLVALALAVVSGLLALYIDKPFGSMYDYLMALLWGFGMDNGIRGVGQIFQKVSG